jgi:putative SOS response-associated peptidase YedK
MGFLAISGLMVSAKRPYQTEAPPLCVIIYGLTENYESYLAAFRQTRIPVKSPDAIPNLQPREDIWPTDKAPVIRRLEDGTNEIHRTPMRLYADKRPPVINFRSDRLKGEP